MIRTQIVKTVLALFLAFALGASLLSCNGKDSAQATVNSPSAAATRSGVPSVSMIQGLDAHKALALADKWGTKEDRVTSFVDTKHVSFQFRDGSHISVPLPDSTMVVAVAPYLTYTHDCEIHYMSGCQGELANVPVKVYAESPDGTVLVDKTMITLDNGFFELWLPRDEEIQLTVEAMGKQSTSTIATYENSNTCITTMKLL